MPWCFRSTLEAKRRTKEMAFLDRRSYVGIRLDGREFLKLFGKDMEAQHERVRYRDRGTCQICFSPCAYSGELDHIKSRGRGGDDSLENLRWICSKDHRRRHVRVKWAAQEKVNA